MRGETLTAVTELTKHAAALSELKQEQPAALVRVAALLKTVTYIGAASALFAAAALVAALLE